MKKIRGPPNQKSPAGEVSNVLPRSASSLSSPHFSLDKQRASVVLFKHG